MISIVIPVFNEAEGMKENIQTIMTCIPVTYELILVDDGSKDETWNIIQEMAVQNHQITGIRFSRNFGKEAALMAGIRHSQGKAVITMDSDLQHPPEYIPLLLQKWKEGYSIVEIRKEKRMKESFCYRLMARGFYRLLKRLSGLDMDNSSDYQLLDRRVVEVLKQFGEGKIFFRGIVDWVGFERCVLEKEFHERKQGKSKFHLKTLTRLALDAITSFSSSLLYFAAILGVIFSIGAIVLGIQTMMNHTMGRIIEDFMINRIMLLMMGSLLLFCMAIIGLYVGKIYQEIKKRPQFIVSETTQRL